MEVFYGKIRIEIPGILSGFSHIYDIKNSTDFLIRWASL